MLVSYLVDWAKPRKKAQMANILFSWELGGGIGHIAPYRDLIPQLLAEGHRVTFALRDLARAERILSGCDIQYFQAPVHVRMHDRIERPLSYPHILYNVGWSDPDALTSYVRGWRSILDSVKPTLVVIDHSPTALLALRGTGIKPIVVGTGFCCPPDMSPFPSLRPWCVADGSTLHADEEVLANANDVLARLKCSAIDRLGQIFSEVRATVLTTLPEFDHYPQRPNKEYWGALRVDIETKPEWPNGEGIRVFAYLKPFPSMGRLLGAIRDRRYAAIIYIEGVFEQVRRKFECETLRVVNTPINLRRVAEECDVAILNGNHSSTIEMLLSGKPILQIPLTLEQYHLASTVARLGVGANAVNPTGEQVVAAFDAVAGSPDCGHRAELFASNHAEFDSAKALHRFRDLLLRLAEE